MFSQEIAERAIEHDPIEFTYIGSGVARKVYLHLATGIVYKILHDSEHRDYAHAQYAEVENAERLRDLLPVGTRIPDCTLFETESGPVVAMEFVPGPLVYDVAAWVHGLEAHSWDLDPDVLHHIDSTCFEMLWPLRDLPLYDMHGENVIMDENGVLVIIDIAD